MMSGTSEWVVRAGTAQPVMLQKGYARHDGMPSVYGFSVQYAPGTSVEELARAGRFPNAHISYARLDALMAAVAPLGYRAGVVKSPGRGYHHTFVVLYDASGAMLRTLPLDAAEALSRTFQRMVNPHRVR